MRNKIQGLSNRTFTSKLKTHALAGSALALAAFSAFTTTADCQIYVTSDANGSVGAYNLDGTSINSSLITGQSAPYGLGYSNGNLYVGRITGAQSIGVYSTSGTSLNSFPIAGAIGIAFSGNTLYAANYSSGTVGTYDATTGAAINSSLIAGLASPYGIALDGGYLYVVLPGSDSVGKYDAATGAVINSSFISGVSSGFGIAIANGSIFVANFDYQDYRVGKYDLSTGAAINEDFITGISGPTGVAYYDGSLYVAGYSANSIGQYDATTGAAINANLITGISSPVGIVVVPEPSSIALLCAGGLALFLFKRSRITRQA